MALIVKGPDSSGNGFEYPVWCATLREKKKERVDVVDRMSFVFLEEYDGAKSNDASIFFFSSIRSRRLGECVSRHQDARMMELCAR